MALVVVGLLLAWKVYDGSRPATYAGSTLQPVVRRIPNTPASPPDAASIEDLESRFVSRYAVEVWGRVQAPDGSSVRLRVRSSSVRADLAVVPVVAGRFYARARVPERMRRRRITVSASLVR